MTRPAVSVRHLLPEREGRLSPEGPWARVERIGSRNAGPLRLA